MFTNSKRKRAVARLEAAVADVKSRQAGTSTGLPVWGLCSPLVDWTDVMELDLREADPQVRVRRP
jgi:hypothetical protein